MFELPSILTAESLLDKAFGRAAKATATGPDRATRARSLAIARVRGAGQAIDATLRGYVKGFPSLDRLPAFYRELVDVLLDVGRLKKHLAALDWAADKVREITRLYRGRIGRATGSSIAELRREAYGRFSSIVKQIGPDLEALVDARKALRRVPEVDPSIPTIVVAGYPNVGKSSFVRAASTGRPKVADYPFTTKGVSLGHFDRGVHRYQILDTRAARPADGPAQQDGTPSDRGARASCERSALPPRPHRDVRLSSRRPTSASRGGPDSVPGCAPRRRRDEE